MTSGPEAELTLPSTAITQQQKNFLLKWVNIIEQNVWGLLDFKGMKVRAASVTIRGTEVNQEQ